MRSPRIILYDDDPFVTDFLRQFFVMRNYEIMVFAEPLVCPVYGTSSDSCRNVRPCSDMVLIDYDLPRMNGIDLLQRQIERGCALSIRNKAIMSGYLYDQFAGSVKKMGFTFLQKPLSFSQLSDWARGCEGRVDLSKPVAIQRREIRRPIDKKVTFSLNSGSDDLFTGDLINISPSGLCLRSSRPLERDQIVRFPEKLPNAWTQASVRWSKRIGNICVAGMMCC